MNSRYISVEIRREILKIAQKRCEYCKSPKDFSTDLYAYDHIIPVALGGKTIFLNLAYSCGSCNSYKNQKTADVDEVSKVEVALFHPRLQKWSDHFEWSDDFKYVKGITPTGRATVKGLRLNRQEVVNFRGVLILAQEHPPI
jgi:hypothetical protein